MRDIAGMIGARRHRDAKLGAEERSAQFGDEFFDGISVIAKAFAKFAIATSLRTRPMQIMPISA